MDMSYEWERRWVLPLASMAILSNCSHDLSHGQSLKLAPLRFEVSSKTRPDFTAGFSWSCSCPFHVPKIFTHMHAIYLNLSRKFQKYCFHIALHEKSQPFSNNSEKCCFQPVLADSRWGGWVALCAHAPSQALSARATQLPCTTRQTTWKRSQCHRAVIFASHTTTPSS